MALLATATVDLADLVTQGGVHLVTDVLSNKLNQLKNDAVHSVVSGVTPAALIADVRSVTESVFNVCRKDNAVRPAVPTTGAEIHAHLQDLESTVSNYHTALASTAKQLGQATGVPISANAVATRDFVVQGGISIKVSNPDHLNRAATLINKSEVGEVDKWFRTRGEDFTKSLIVAASLTGGLHPDTELATEMAPVDIETTTVVIQRDSTTGTVRANAQNGRATLKAVTANTLFPTPIDVSIDSGGVPTVDTTNVVCSAFNTAGAPLVAVNLALPGQGAPGLSPGTLGNVGISYLSGGVQVSQTGQLIRYGEETDYAYTGTSREWQEDGVLTATLTLKTAPEHVAVADASSSQFTTTIGGTAVVAHFAQLPIVNSAVGVPTQRAYYCNYLSYRACDGEMRTSHHKARVPADALDCFWFVGLLSSDALTTATFNAEVAMRGHANSISRLGDLYVARADGLEVQLDSTLSKLGGTVVSALMATRPSRDVALSAHKAVSRKFPFISAVSAALTEIGSNSGALSALVSGGDGTFDESNILNDLSQLLVALKEKDAPVVF
jgi:hypothetical protein